MPALPGPALSEEEAKREEDLIILHVDLESPARTDERHAFSEEVDVLVTELATTVSGKQIAEWINRAHLHHVSRARMGCLLALQTERNLHEAVKISQVIITQPSWSAWSSWSSWSASASALVLIFLGLRLRLP